MIIRGRQLTEDESKLFDMYMQQAEEEQNRLFPFGKNELSQKKATMHNIIMEKYLVRFQKAIGVPDDKIIVVNVIPKCLKDYPKPLDELNDEDLRRMMDIMIEETRKAIEASDEDPEELTRRLKHIIKCLNLHHNDTCINRLQFSAFNEEMPETIHKRLLSSLGEMHTSNSVHNDEREYSFMNEDFKIVVSKPIKPDVYYVDITAVDETATVDAFDRCLKCGSLNIANGIFGSGNLSEETKRLLNSGQFFYLPACYHKPGTRCPNRWCKDCGYKWFDEMTLNKDNFGYRGIT
ncbi:MAG: hypothetical protein E7233_01790 [Lachnospiraceae bacterium]|nr:hypothetical protein [Lachnospiraceae bacterium]